MPFARIFVAVVICSALALCLALAVKRFRGPQRFRSLTLSSWSNSQEVRVIEVRRIGMHGDIALIEHGDRRYLLLVQSGSSTLLREVTIETGGGSG